MLLGIINHRRRSAQARKCSNSIFQQVKVLYHFLPGGRTICSRSREFCTDGHPPPNSVLNVRKFVGYQLALKSAKEVLGCNPGRCGRCRLSSSHLISLSSLYLCPGHSHVVSQRSVVYCLVINYQLPHYTILNKSYYLLMRYAPPLSHLSPS